MLCSSELFAAYVYDRHNRRTDVAEIYTTVDSLTEFENNNNNRPSNNFDTCYDCWVIFLIHGITGNHVRVHREKT